MRIVEEISFRLKVSAFVCALLVTTIHCWSPEIWFLGESGFSAWQAAVAFLVTGSISRVAVPWFFVMTGFFLARSFSEGGALNLIGWYGATLKKRFWSIYVPFVIWNLAYVALYLAFGGKHGCSLDAPVRLLSKVFGWDPYGRLGCMQFWYLQTVIMWVVTSIVVLPLLYGRRWLQIGATGVLFVGWTLGIIYLPRPLAIGNFLWLMFGSALGFSDVGVLLAQRPQSSQSIIKPYPILRELSVRQFAVVVFISMLSITAIIKVYGGVVRNMAVYGWADKCIIVFGVASLVCLVFGSGHNFRVFSVFRGSAMRQILGLSFFIFAFHGVVVTVVGRLCARMSVSEFATYGIKVLSALTLPILVGLVFRRASQRLFALICGGRG